MPYKRTVGHACLYFSTSREPAVGPPWKRQVRSLHMRACAQYLLHRFLEQENGIHQDYGVHASVMRLASGRRPSTCLCALRSHTYSAPVSAVLQDPDFAAGTPTRALPQPFQPGPASPHSLNKQVLCSWWCQKEANPEGLLLHGRGPAALL
eukprot:1159377-Pelagomonas_calceolata.AAC.1